MIQAKMAKCNQHLTEAEITVDIRCMQIAIQTSLIGFVFHFLFIYFLYVSVKEEKQERK